MNSEGLFKMALGLESPWKITQIEFTTNHPSPELHITIDFDKGAKFKDQANKDCSVYDTNERTWRHLNFFQHACYLHCRVPRIKTSDDKVKQVDVPWARPGSGFTMLFEAYTMMLIEGGMSINRIGRLLQIIPHRIWTIFNYWIARAKAQTPLNRPHNLGIDETSRRRGHEYLTLFVDMLERRVIHIEEGKGKATIAGFRDYLTIHGIAPQWVQRVSMDMSPSFISGINEHFKTATIHFDKFHVIKLLNEAMDKVRQLERKEHDELKGYKYLFLRNKDHLPTKQQQTLSELITLFPTLGKAYRFKELFNDLWEMPNADVAYKFLNDWCDAVEKENIGPFKQFVNTVRTHFYGIINFCETKINNGLLEGINSKVQLAKRKARGYRNIENFKNMIYFLCGKLNLDYPLRSS